MKKNKFQWFWQIFILLGIVTVVTLTSCKKDEDDPPPANPIASFQFAIDATDFLKVSFTNFSQNAVSYSWNFGDSQTSTETSPTHVYTSAGTYVVVLTAKNSADASATYSQTIEIKDPDVALKLLTGETSKTWKLYREGVSMSLGPNADDPAGWWPGLLNNGQRPCSYYQEFTFHRNGAYVFNDNGEFWGEYGVFNDQWNYEICFEAIPANMINKDGNNVSAWLSGTHAFTYNAALGTVTLNGLGAWIGIPKLGTSAETIVPAASVTFNVNITEHTGYDLLTIAFDWGAAGYWKIVYVNYSNLSLEPAVVVDAEPYGEDLPDLTPTEMFNTFVAPDSFVLLDTAAVYPGTGLAGNGVNFTIGVANPDGGTTPVGQYDRIGQYQELQFQMNYDIQFDNFTTVTLDVFVPSTNDYTGDLTKAISIIIGEASQTEQWWTQHIQYDVNPDDVIFDQWQTWTFQLDSPTSGPGGYTPYDRNDLDFFAITIGGGGHTAPGTFYIRNFSFN